MKTKIRSPSWLLYLNTLTEWSSKTFNHMHHLHHIETNNEYFLIFSLFFLFNQSTTSWKNKFMAIFSCKVTEEKMGFYMKKQHIIWTHLGTAMFYCNSHYLLVSITVRALKKPIKSWKVSVKKLSQKGKEIEFFTAVFIHFFSFYSSWYRKPVDNILFKV